MIITQQLAKSYLKVDIDEDNELIDLQISAIEEHLKNATGIEFDDTNAIAKLYCLYLLQNMYENRTYTVPAKEDINPTAVGLLLQLKYSYTTDEIEESI